MIHKFKPPKAHTTPNPEQSAGEVWGFTAFGHRPEPLINSPQTNHQNSPYSDLYENLVVAPIKNSAL